MKIDRLYGEMLCLLRRGTVSASELAEKFEVSIRTVQRDMDSLALAGVPVSSLLGPNGGYRIERTFEIRQHPVTDRDYSNLRTALRGLASAADSPDVQTTLMKLLGPDAGGPQGEDGGMILDFSVLREGNFGEALRQLQAAVAGKRLVSFQYTNAAGDSDCRTVEPVAVVYRWYSWYLLGYPQNASPEQGPPSIENYRLYKLIRMQNIETGGPFTRQHPPGETLLREKEAAEREKGAQSFTRVTLRCSPAQRTKVAEYLKGTVVETLENGDLMMQCTVVETEHFWLGTLLGLGGQVEVVSPEHIRARLLEAAEKIVACYRKPDKLLS